jgi:branched-chain amino acid transport system substrate-binding protein
VLARDDGYGKRLGAALEDGLSDTGVEVVSDGRYSDNPAATVVTDLVASAAAAAPDAVVLLGFQEAGAFLTELAANGIGTDRVWGGNALGGEEAPLLGAEGVRGVRHLATDDSAFTARLLDARPELEGTFFAAASYDAVVTVALATATASSDTGRDIADALAGVTRPGAANCTDVANCLNLVEEGAAITYDGALGISDLGEANQPDGGTFEVFQIEADGSRPTIGTVSTATR